MVPYPLRQLAELCREAPLTPKVLFAPGVRSGYNLTAALARAGTRWTNLRVTTPVLHATEKLQPQLAAQGGRRLDAEGRQLLVDSLLAIHLESLTYFRAAAAAPGLARALRRTFDDLRLGDVSPASLSRQGEDGSAKLQDLSQLYADYCHRLHADSWWDDARLLTAATAAPGGLGPKDATIWILTDETELPTLAHRYVEAATAGELRRLGRLQYGISPPAHSVAARFASCSPAGATAIAPPHSSPAAPPASPAPKPSADVVQGDLFLDRLRDSDEPDLPLPPSASPKAGADGIDVAPGGRLLTDGLRPSDGDRVRLWLAVGLETEVRAVLRDILGRGLALDDVEIVYTSQTPYQSLLHDAVERWELPADFASGVPAALSRPGRSLVAFLGWLAGGLDGLHLARALRTGAIDWRDEAAPAYRVASLLSAAGVGRGLEAAGEALQRLEAAAAPTDERAERQREMLERARSHLARLHAYVPDGSTTLGRVADAAADFLQAVDLTGYEAVDRDLGIRDSLVTRLRDLAAGPPLRGTRPDHASRLLDIVQTSHVDARRASPGRVHMTSLAAAGYSGRGHIYVIGLDDSHFPGPVSEDPILTDDERRHLGDLGARRSRAPTAVFHLLRLLGAVSKDVTLVASCLHLADGREPSPAPLFKLAGKQLQVEPTWHWPLSSGPENGLADDMEGAVAQRGATGYRQAVAAVFPDAEQGARAQSARDASAPSRFDGWVRTAGEQDLTVAGDRVLSPSLLETLAVCPRRYLLRDVLRIRALDEMPRDPRRWLHPLEMGELLHGLFLDFMEQLQACGERPGVEHEARLSQMVAAAIEQARLHHPAPLEAAFRNDERRIQRAARIFLHAEAQRLQHDPALTPHAFEWDFGGPEGVEVSLSSEVSFRLRGRIDRVDHVEGGRLFEIWDYKTGSTWGYRQADLLSGGRNLQWALYAAALPQLLDGAQVRRSGYFFASDRGAGQRFADRPPEAAELAALLLPLFGLTEAGFFPAVHKGERWGGDACRFCDYRRVCAGEARGEMHMAEQIEAAEELTTLVDGWAQTVTAQRAGRRSLEAELARRGYRPDDVVPESVVALIRDWVTA